MKKADKYWYVRLLISDANKLLAQRRFADAFTKWMIESNQGHSGWTSGVDSIFHKPKNKKERELARQLRTLVLKIARGLLEKTKPTAGILAYMDVEAIGVCLLRLDKDAPLKLIDDLLNLMAKCKESGAPPQVALTVPLGESIPELKEKIREVKNEKTSSHAKLSR